MMPREPVYGAAVGDDVEEAQEFAIFLIVGGLYSVTALRKNNNEGRSVYRTPTNTTKTLVTEAWGSAGS